MNDLEVIARAAQAAEREMARRFLLDFTRATFRGYRTNWHHEIIAAALDSWVENPGQKILVTMPPRHGKSELCTRRLPAYLLGKNPDAKIIAATYSGNKASKENRRVQRIMESQSYQQIFPNTKLSRGQIGEMRSSTEGFTIPGYGGYYLGAGVGGGITGEGATHIIIDDPVKSREEAESPTVREHVWNWYTDDLLTRADTADISVLLIMTRWHEDDLAGRIMQHPEYGKDWTVIELQAIKEDPATNERDPYEGKRMQFTDPRSPGESIWPDKYPPRYFVPFMSNPRTWNSLFRQRPSSPEGNEFRRDHFPRFRMLDLMRRAREAGQELRPRFVWDTAQSEKSSAAYSVILAYYVFEGDVYLFDVLRVQKSIVDLLPLARDFFDKCGYTTLSRIGVEPKSSGPDIIKLLKREGYTISEIKMPSGDKHAKARGIMDYTIAGRVHVLDGAPWLDTYLQELCDFPLNKYWDQVDTTVFMVHDAIGGSGRMVVGMR